MRLRLIGILAVMAMVIAFAAPVAADAPNDCPDPQAGDFVDGSTSGGESGEFTIDGVAVEYDVSADGKTITFSRAVTFCVKGGSEANSGLVTGTTYTVNFENGGGQTPAISNIVVYSVSVTPPNTNVTAAAASVTAPSCTAAGMLVVPANTAQVSYSVSPAYTAGATGTFTVTATANAGFTLVGTSQWTLTVAAKVTGAACVTGGGTLPGNPTTPATPVRGGTLGSSLPNTATDVPATDGAPTILVALMAVAIVACVGGRNLVAARARR